MGTAGRGAIIALTIVFACLGVTFAAVAPTFQAPDEPPHLDMIRHQAVHPFDVPGPDLRMSRAVQDAVEQVGLPQGGPIEWQDGAPPRPAYTALSAPGGDAPASHCVVRGMPPTCQNYHYVHPPTYYVLTAPIVALLEDEPVPRVVLVLRLLGVALAAPAVALTAVAARRVWPHAVGRPIAAAAGVALFTPFAAAAAAMNNDALLYLLGAVAVAAMAALVRAPSPLRAGALGAVAGAAMLVKVTAVPLAAAVGIVAVVAAAAADDGRRLRTLAAFALPAAVGGAWWLANVVRFGSFQPAGTEILQPPRPGPHTSTSVVRYATEHVDELIDRFWGLYGQTAVATPQAWTRALTLACVGLALGWVVARPWRRPTARGARIALLGLAPVLLGAASVATSYAVYRRSGEVRGLLGRYLYPGLPAIAIGLAAAVGAIADRLRAAPVRAAAAAAWIGGLTILAAAAAAHALRGLYGTSDLSLLLARAHAVAPTAVPGRWLAVAAVVAAAGVVASAAFTVAAVRQENPKSAAVDPR